MLDMSIEMFAVRLEEIIEKRKELIRQEKAIGCWEMSEGDSVLIYDEKRLLEFANYKGLPVNHYKIKDEEFLYTVSTSYQNVKFLSYFVEVSDELQDLLQKNSTLTDQS